MPSQLNTWAGPPKQGTQVPSAVQLPEAVKNINGPPSTYALLVVPLIETTVVSLEVSVTVVVVLREGATIATVPDITIAATIVVTTTGATRGCPGPDPSVAIDSSRVEEVTGHIKFRCFERAKKNHFQSQFCSGFRRFYDTAWRTRACHFFVASPLFHTGLLTSLWVGYCTTRFS
jgi:hypothetical protein